MNAHPIFTLGRIVRDRQSGILEIRGGAKTATLRFKEGQRVAGEAPVDVSTLASILNAADARATFSGHDVGAKAQEEPGERTLISACEALSIETLVRVGPAFGEERAGLSLPAAYRKEIPPLPVTPEELGLVKVVLHNPTLQDVLSASFLGRERILRLLFAYHLLGWISIQGERDRALGELLASLSPEQRALRDDLLGLEADFSAKTFYEWLALQPYAANAEILTATQRRIELCLSPATEKLFLEDERGLLRSLLAKTEEARNVLTHPVKRAEYAAFVDKGGRGSFIAQNREIQGLDAVANAQKLEMQGQKEAAVAAYEGHLRQFPDQIDALSAYSISLLRMFGPSASERQKRALSLLKTMLEKHPQHPATFISSIEWLRATQQKSKVFEFARKAFSIHPAHPYFRKELIEGGHDAGAATVVSILHPVRAKMNHYQILGLTPQASAEEIRSSYRTLSKALHPDRFFQSTDETLKTQAKDLYKKVVDAHTTLKDPQKRRDYDRLTFSRTA